MATRFRDHSVPICEDPRRDFSQARADFLIVDGCPLSRAIARLCQKAGFVKAVLSHETEQLLGIEALPETDDAYCISRETIVSRDSRHPTRRLDFREY